MSLEVLYNNEKIIPRTSASTCTEFKGTSFPVVSAMMIFDSIRDILILVGRDVAQVAKDSSSQIVLFIAE